MLLQKFNPGCREAGLHFPIFAERKGTISPIRKLSSAKIGFPLETVLSQK